MSDNNESQKPGEQQESQHKPAWQSFVKYGNLFLAIGTTQTQQLFSG